jgi:protein kinase C substrate 80K-H
VGRARKFPPPLTLPAPAAPPAGTASDFVPSFPEETKEPEYPESSELTAAKAAAAAAATAATTAASELSTAEADEKVDFGPDGVFFSLKGQCFSFRAGAYNYEACPFAGAKQDHTSLGIFSGWAAADGGAPDYARMAFKNGAHCWNGPARSLTVSFECGAKDELVSIDEPEKCTYAARMTTPAACDDMSTRALQLDTDGDAEL